MSSRAFQKASSELDRAFHWALTPAGSGYYETGETQSPIINDEEKTVYAN